MIDPRSIPVREPLARECARAWERLALPGTWWSGAERLALSSESRRARRCALCRARKQALSPYAVDGTHDTLGTLPPAAVEAVHRITTDAGRLTRKWLAGVLADGLAEEQYVEIVGVVAVITALDTFDLALGRSERALPAARPGAPSRRRPAAARRDLAWVSTVAPDAYGPADIDPYKVHGVKHIHRALSLVPQEVLNFFDLDVELYLKDHEIRDFSREYRALSHVQMEFLAARVSSLNGCYY
jgi:hypothetical protein